jgi:hypothetical protein
MAGRRRANAGEELFFGGGRRFRVLDVVVFGEERPGGLGRSCAENGAGARLPGITSPSGIPGNHARRRLPESNRCTGFCRPTRADSKKRIVER